MKRAILWKPSRGFAGLCDRLRSLAAIRRLAWLHDAEVTVVRWPVNKACPFRLGEVTASTSFIEYDGNEPPEFSFQQEFTHDANSWCGVYIDSWPSVFDCYETFSAHVEDGLADIFNACPFVPVFDKWAKFAGFSGDVVGIHLRRTDNVNASGRIESIAAVAELDALMLRGIASIIEQRPGVRFFLASDSKSYELDWPNKILQMNGNVLTYPKEFDESQLRQTSLDGLMGDIIGLSKCESVLCSCSSSVLLVASRIHRKPRIIEIR